MKKLAFTLFVGIMSFQAQATEVKIPVEFVPGTLKMKHYNTVMESECADSDCSQIFFLHNGERITRNISKEEFSLKLEDYGEKVDNKIDIKEEMRWGFWSMPEAVFTHTKLAWRDGAEVEAVVVGTTGVLLAPVAAVSGLIQLPVLAAINLFRTDDLRKERLEEDSERLQKTAKIIKKMASGTYERKRDDYYDVYRFLTKNY